MKNPQSDKIATIWTKHLSTPEERKKFEETLRNTTFILSRLKDITLEKEQTILSRERNESEYDNPNWAYKQAYLNGYIAGIRSVQDLLRFLP